MRRYILFWVCLFCCLLATAQTKYRVTTNSHLNVRSYASASAPKMGTLSNGSEVEVYEISNGWAKIKYGYAHAYVKAQYLSEVDEQPVVTTSSQNSRIDISFGLSDDDLEGIAIIIAILSGFLFIIDRSREDKPLKGVLYVANLIMFLATALLEIVYVIRYQNYSIWFCSISEVGWLWAIIDFFIFGGIVINQIFCLFNTLDDIQCKSDVVDIRLGLYSIIVGSIAGIITGIWFQSALIYVLIALAIFQLIQIVIIFKSIVPCGGLGNAFLFLFVYLFGTIATLAILGYFLLLLVIALIALLVIFVLGYSNSRGSSSSSSSYSSADEKKCCRNCSHYYSDGRCDWYNRTISDYESGNHYCQYYN